ncbi:EAL domain-containing protein [Photobacterium sp.]|uniref:bifunctional diguanylate cyclase/phosphodiesterase n=1 Tax=Photobacterium sp. TaxID=660 RepID=UPI00299EF649|nr:EAL domain-containing protein [Photobacterium sp.]MDX1303217.1 EAL domain-containing protein [Photobacterium sp.]
MKLKVKLPILLVLLLCIPQVLLGTIAFVELRSTAEQGSVTQITKFLEQIVAQTDRLVKTAQANVELITEDDLLRNYILTDDKEERYTLMQRPLLSKLKSIMQVFPEYYEMRVILPDGYEDLRLTVPFIPNQTETEQGSVLFSAIAKNENNHHAKFMVNPDNGEFSLYVSKRLDIINKAVDSFTALPKVRGYLVITVNLEVLNDALSDFSWSGGRFLITEQSGEVVLPYSAKNAKTITPLDLASKLKSAEESTFNLLDIEGKDYYHTSVNLQHQLRLHALLPYKVLLQSSRNISMLVAIITLFSIIIFIPLLVSFSHFQIVRPLKNLHQAFLRLSHDNELVQVKTSGDDELNELGHEFNRMSFKLFKSNEKIRDLAFNDFLTGLPNRFMFTKHLNRTLESAINDNSHLAVMFIDLDNFKQINDSLGHCAGDQLLHEVALRIHKNLREKDCISYINERDMIARLGGDEFTVLLTGDSAVAGVEKVAQRILDVIALPIKIDDKNYYISGSIGIACYPENGITTQELIKNADIAMYHAKKMGRGRYQNFTDMLSQQNYEFSNIGQKMHEAIEREVFELYFQPIIDGRTHHITSLEALIRWNDPELGWIPPDLFIPLAEKNGLITAIGDWVIREACRQLKVWQDMGITEIQLAINVSAIQLNNLNFAEELSDCIMNSGIIPGSLYIELTETAIINGEQDVFAMLERLHDKNINIALDDFGTGYSSLSYLRNLPIDILKIDRSFMCEINNRNNNVILSAVITMAHALGFKVVAEGVEEPEHLAFLLKEGCDMLQGYMFSRPKPAGEITTLLVNELTGKTKRGAGMTVPDYF